LFEEDAVNYASIGRTSDEQIMAMEGIIRNLRGVNPEIDIVLMHFVDPKKMESYRKGKVPEVIQNHESVAEYYEIPSIHLAKEVTDRIDNKEFTWEEDFKNLHPSPFGQGVYAHSIISFLKSKYAASVAEDDKVVSYSLPRMLHPNSYDNGVLYPSTKIKIVQGWNVITYWEPKDGAKTRSNYTKVPMLIGQKPGVILKFPFEGNAVGIAIAAGKDAGIIEYRIDKGAWKKQNLFLSWSKQIHLPWYFTLQTGLQRGKHLLELKVSEEKDPRSRGNACRIRYFFVNK
jgi:sialidase-1